MVTTLQVMKNSQATANLKNRKSESCLVYFGH